MEVHINRNTCISHSSQKFSVPATDDDRKHVHAIRNIKIKDLHNIDDGTAVALKAKIISLEPPRGVSRYYNC